MFDAGGLAVSLPARELAAVSLPGAVFSPDALAAAPVSADLHRAVALVAAECRRRRLPITLVARPEMFTDAATLDWLRARLGGIGSHLSLSDGHAVGVLPGMRNHMFLYRLGLPANAEAFRRLMRRAPGFLAGMAGQVNTAFRFAPNRFAPSRFVPGGFVPGGFVPGGFVPGRSASSDASPPSLLLLPRGEAAAPAPAGLLPFYLNGRSAEQSAAWITAKGPADAQRARSFARVTYLPLTETALADRATCETVAASVAHTYFTAAQCLLLRLPVADAPAATLAERLAAMLARLRTARTRLPRVPAANVFCLADDLDTATLQGFAGPVDLVVPDGFDFWRHPAAFYKHFASVTALVAEARRPERARLAALLAKAFGRAAELRWLEKEDA